MNLEQQVKHFTKLAAMHTADHSPAKARHYECKARIAELKIEINELTTEAKKDD